MKTKKIISEFTDITHEGVVFTSVSLEFMSEDYFAVVLNFPDGSFRRLYISHKALFKNVLKQAR